MALPLGTGAGAGGSRDRGGSERQGRGADRAGHQRPERVGAEGQRAGDGAVGADHHRGRGAVRLVGRSNLAVLLEQQILQSQRGHLCPVGVGGAAADDGDRQPGRVLTLPAGKLGEQRVARNAVRVGEDEQDRLARGAQRVKGPCLPVQARKRERWGRGANRESWSLI